MTEAAAAEEVDVTTTTTNAMIAETVDAEMITVKVVKSTCRSRSPSPQMPAIIKEDAEEKETIVMRSGSRRTIKKGSVLLLSFSLKLIFRIKSATSSNHTTLRPARVQSKKRRLKPRRTIPRKNPRIRLHQPRRNRRAKSQISLV